MGSVRDYIEKHASLAEAGDEMEKMAHDEVLTKLAMFKLAQDLVEAGVTPEDLEAAVAEGAGGEEMMGGEEGEMPSEEELAEVLNGIIEEVNSLSDEEKEQILQTGDAIEDEEAAAGEKVSTVMDYAALIRYLGL